MIFRPDARWTFRHVARPMAAALIVEIWDGYAHGRWLRGVSD
ncbi:hypothetical protein BMIN_1470 [Bifidobacterium minimum]|uniref:Transposase n=1 Tax=Bifidobacterium minimum TaxID=1693 RepID=A0A087BLA5_9BIFI|nr:hypothetical protein BMIN_1470 [Bifidobacterium minimum]